MDKNKQLIAAGASALIIAGYYLYKTYQAAPKPAEEEKKQETPTSSTSAAVAPAQPQKEQIQIQTGDSSGDAFFTDPGFDSNHYLTKIEAANRSEFISNVSYKLILGLVKGGQTYHGKITIEYTLNKVAPAYVANGDNSKCLFLDYKGKSMRSICVNGTKISPVDTPNLWNDHRIYIPPANQIIGVNQAIIEFETFYVTDCQGFQYFKDDADGSEYIYTELEPDYCHICFPCFDQPDLKANHKTSIIAPSDWAVIANSENIFQTDEVTGASQDQEFKDALERFDITQDSPIVTSFGDSKIKMHEFARTKQISTYLFAFVAGPFDCLRPSEERENELPHIPMHLYCRKSLTQYAEKLKDDWFRITKASIRFYEQMFDTPYPFDKLDSVFCPDYAMGAMENVGCITYNDDYIPRDENFTRYKTENIFNTIAHEISHMWFGNLVTMKWWDDLWLNESFANCISYMAMDEGQGFEDVTLAWNIFLDEQYWGLSEDQKNTSHPIACTVRDTGCAQDIFDGISYGKGAAFLHQMVFFLGKDMMKQGLKTYFAKYSYKNTELKDFIAELDVASTQLGLQVNFREWADSWLSKPGCAEINLNFDHDTESGVITNLKLVQKPYNAVNIEGNMLRIQAFNITALDEDMKIIEVHRVETSATEQETVIDKFTGPQAKKVHALLINHGAHGYGKFRIDEMTLQALETGLYKIESSLDRKQIMNMMYDNIKSGKIPASRVIKIIINNLEHETAVDVLQDTLGFICNATLKSFLHSEVVEERTEQLYEIVMNIMMSGRFNDYPAAMETLLSSAIGFSTNQVQHETVMNWFASGLVTRKNSKPIKGTSINVKVRHTMVRKIFASPHISKEHKKECFAKLATFDQTDMLGRTEKFCEAADPDPTSKRAAFTNIFENTDIGLQHIQEMCRGYRQSTQKDLIETFAEDFFNKIEECVNKRAHSNTRYIYLFLVPTLNANDTDLTRLNALKNRLEGYNEEQKQEGTDRLLKWVRESIQEVEEKKASKAISKTWEDAQQ